MKKELASGNGTASSFSCRSAIGRGRGLIGISGSSSSSSPTIDRKGSDYWRYSNESLKQRPVMML